MEFLPDGRFMLSERSKTTQSEGRLWLVTPSGTKIAVSGLPANLGVLDIKLDPAYSSNNLIYVSFMEEAAPSEPRVGRNAADMSRVPEGLAVFRAKLVVTTTTAKVETVSVIWRQVPKVVSHPGSGEPGGHITFSPDGRFLFIAAGDRQEFEPVQDLATTLGKVVRIYPDGSIPTDNPFVGRAGARPEIWSLGHRNPYGLAFDPRGQLWEHEMGPKGGDEFNKIVSGGNYGWPLVSNGQYYDSDVDNIPDHAPGDGFVAPDIFWTPVVSPAGLIFYSGNVFAAWKGNALMGGLSGKRIVRISTTGMTATIVQSIPMPNRIRDIEEAPDGALWIIEDAPAGTVAKLAPIFAP